MVAIPLTGRRAEILFTQEGKLLFMRSPIELALLDCARYMSRAGGLSGVLQVTKDLGARADPRRLAKAAARYDGAAVRRLGYLLEKAGHTMQARALRRYAENARHFEPLDPDVTPAVADLANAPARDSTWKLLINAC